MSNPAPGFKQRPEHRITVNQAGAHVRVTYRGEVIADTRQALVMREGSYAPVYYVPREDARMERLSRTSHHTHCPFKGDASYYSIAGGPENAVWSYEQPFDEMLAIKGLLAFYPDKVDVEVTTTP